MDLKLEVLVLPVSDVDRAKAFYEGLAFRLDADFTGRGVEISEIFHDADGVFHHFGTENRVSGPHPERADYSSFASFSDPDGNGWVLQEIKNRLPGR
jgi:catechol 2,3-dioxygenase-like lactoylglutathione lyase family enzyme